MSGRQVADLLLDHVLVDDSWDDSQGNDVSSCGQNLCNIFVLEMKPVSSRPGNQEPRAALHAGP